MYINHGGIGLTLSRGNELDGLRGNEMRSLILREGEAGPVIAHQTPSSPWTTESLAQALQSAAGLISEHCPVDAYLGDVFLGSTEL